MKLGDLRNVDLSDLALLDLDEIWTFIARDSTYYADKTIENLVARMALLGLNPKVGAERDDFSPGLRLFPYNDYNIFYFPNDHGVEVYRVLHCARDPVQILAEDPETSN